MTLAPAPLDPGALLEAAFEHAGVAQCIVAADGTVLRANAEWLRATRRSADEVIGADVGALFPQARRFAAAVRARALAGEVVEIPKHRQRIGDADVWWAGRVSPVPVVGGTALLVTVLDVTAEVARRRAAEAALHEREAFLRNVIDLAPSMVFVKDRDGRFVLVNEALARCYGATVREIVGKTDSDFNPIAEHVAAFRRADLAVMDSRRPQVIPEELVRHADGELRWYSTVKVPLVRDDGRCDEVLGVATDITDLKRAEEGLRAARQHAADIAERLREEHRRKDHFLGMLSHELRNPLAPIRNSVYLLRHASGADVERSVRVIERQTEHLTRLVDDLLDVTRIARGKIQLRREVLDLRELVRRAGEDFRAVLEDRGIAFRVLVPDRRVGVDADATRVGQVIGNLLHNAAKFTRRGDAVTLALEAGRDEACVHVRDTGAGIDPALLPAMFEPFVQADRTLARSDGGLGLGLALVRGLVELHGGTVRADSAGPGCGAEFTICLPLAAPARDERAGPDAPCGRAACGRRVLVVDDNRDAADSLAQLVAALGHDAEVAYHGPAALAKVAARLPDVVLCDIGLPEVDGYEVGRRIRLLSEEVLLVAVSGYAQPEDVARSVDAGFDVHVAKPADPRRIEELLGRP